MYSYNKSQKVWQKEYISKIYKKQTSVENNGFTNKILSDLNILNSKDKYLPKGLFKFYSNTSENILDIKNKKLWLSHPSTFNDPFDCSIGYNVAEYQKKELINHILKNKLITENIDGFTKIEFQNIVNSYINGEEYRYLYTKNKEFSSLMYDIRECKSKSFNEYIYSFLRDKNNEIEDKMEEISKINIRVACFAGFKNEDGIMNKSQMWAHYADNHKGFCVEYDIRPLKKETVFLHDRWRFWDNQEEYLSERLHATIKGGLFPVIYTSNRVRLPYTKVKKLNINDRICVEELLYKSYITKSTIWSYENEWRLIIDDDISDYYGNKIPFPFIKKIFLGCKMDDRYKKLLIDIGKEHDVEVHIMTMERNKFELDHISSEWYYRRGEERYSNPFTC
jgi:hypothetical protein